MKTILFSQVRRQDRTVEDETFIRDMLARSAAGVLATAAGSRPYVNTNLYVYDEASKALYLHTAREGSTRSAIEQNPRVCFTVFEMGRLLPGPTAAKMSVEYASVVVHGRASIVADASLAEHALELLVKKYFKRLKYGEDYGVITAGDLAETTVIRIDIEEWSGKRKQAPPDLPGAFRYEG